MWRLVLNDGAPLPFLRGESLGAAFAIALREHFRKHVSLTRPWGPVGTVFFGLRPRCAITGAIGIGETLAAVGGMEAKLEAARASKLRLVAPAGNRDAAVHVPDGLHVYWAATVRQASRYARRWHPVRTGIAILIIALFAAVSTVTIRDNQLTRVEDSAAAVQLVTNSPALSESDPVLSRLEAVAAWRLAASDRTGLAMLNAATLPQIADFTCAASAPDSVAFSPDGTLLAVAFGQEGTGSSGVRLWDVHTRQQAGLLQAPVSSEVGNGFGPMAFSPNGKILAQGIDDGTVVLWKAWRPAARSAIMRQAPTVSARPCPRSYSARREDAGHRRDRWHGATLECIHRQAIRVRAPAHGWPDPAKCHRIQPGRGNTGRGCPQHLCRGNGPAGDPWRGNRRAGGTGPVERR